MNGHTIIATTGGMSMLDDGSSIEYMQGAFEPLPDITAYELAIILPMILHGMTREGYESLGPMQRHIRLAS